ncbi:GtrA family protein [Pedobacter panaciterrae]|uniref:GtrA family protein n=1 Tax=Pedobacter panaciterrae TaxID=363849 RepID=UPI003D31EFB6
MFNKFTDFNFFLFKIFRFAIVGFIGLIIDFGTTWIFINYFKSNIYIANIAGFIFAATNNYLLNNCWTFNNRKIDLKKYISFFWISIVGLIINSAIVYVLLNIMHFDFYYSKSLAVIVVFGWNFMANYFLTFRVSVNNISNIS